MLKTTAVGLLIAGALVFAPRPAFAHCDTLDGPVVKDARMALEKNDVRLVLRWVRPADEADVRAAFTRTIAVRALGGEAKSLADTWFFETVVRIHRQGEGAPYEGLKPAGQIEPFMLDVDRSLEVGTADAVLSSVSAEVVRGARERFARARELRQSAGDSVEAGRKYVEAYVDYLHYIERLYTAGTATEAGHEPGTPSAAHK